MPGDLLTDRALNRALLHRQGLLTRSTRPALAMVEQMDREGFGNCSNHYECEAVCPKEIKRQVIGDLNREFMRAGFLGD